MFEKGSKSYTDLLGKTNRLVEGTVVQGNITTSADFRLDGSLTGDLKCGGKLVIGPAAMVRGDIICRNADVEGKVFGKIEVQEMLSVKAKASIHGEVVCAKLSVEPGAEFSATCEMRPHQNLQLEQQPKNNRNKWLALINIPIQMGVIIFLFTWLGKYLDETYPNENNWYVKVLVVLGVFVSLYNVHRQLKEINK